MKKILSLFAVLLLVLCSCSNGGGNERLITADMLNITNTEQTFAGCLDRFNSVISAMKAKVSILEAEHNKSIKVQNPNEYFLENDYILTAFEPFLTSSISITNGFTADMTADAAKDFYKLQSRGMDVVYTSDGKTSFSLKFVSEELIEEYTAEYNQKADSFRFVFKTENGDGERIEEFLEFAKAPNGAYIMQSKTSRCFIEFDADDKIIAFCAGELRSEEFSLDESVFPSTEQPLGKSWVLSRGKSQFLNIHTFENGILTHEECSSGPWKSIKIDAEGYASAFYS